MKALLPFLVKELRVAARERRLYYIRVGYLLLLLGLFVAYWNSMASSGVQHADAVELAYLGRVLFWQVATVQGILVALVGPILSAGLVNTEVRQRTLGLLFAGGLGPIGITAGKWLACVGRTALLAVSGIPLLLIAKALGGATLDQLLLSTWAAMILAFSAPAVGLFFSALCDRYHAALIGSYLFLAGFLFAPQWLDFLAPWRLKIDPISVLAYFESFHRNKQSPYAAMLACSASHAILCFVLLAAVSVLLPGLTHRTAGLPWTKRLGAWIDRLAAVRWRWNFTFGAKVRPPVDTLLRLECAAGLTRTGRAMGRLVVLLFVVLGIAYVVAGRALMIGSTVAEFQIVLCGFLFVALTTSAATVVSRDAERGTLDPLLVTPLSAREIVRAKALATFRGSVPVLALPLMHALTMLASGWYTMGTFLIMVLITGSYSVFCCGLGILSSTLFRRSAPATLVALIVLVLAVVGPFTWTELRQWGYYSYRSSIAEASPLWLVFIATGRYNDLDQTLFLRAGLWAAGWSVVGGVLMGCARACFDLRTGRLHQPRSPQRISPSRPARPIAPPFAPTFHD